MPLSDGYGVVIGTKADYFRDPPDDFGRFYHGNLVVSAPEGDHRCAIDVDPKNMPDGIQWRVVDIDPDDWTAITSLEDGWHDLVPGPDSGALDYIRSAVLRRPTLIPLVPYGGVVARLVRALPLPPPWNSGTGIDALTDLEAIVDDGVRFYVFGEPFSSGLGVHNIHQNQGDPVGGGFDAENAIWQDGATIAERADGTLVGFLNKFTTQSFRTDDLGRPL